MSCSLISLNLQHYNHNLLSYNHSQVIKLLSYNHSQVIHSLPWEANSGVTLLGQSFSLYLKKLQNIFVLLDLSVFYIHTSSE